MMNKNKQPASAARGFSLVELMIALLIGLIIAIGVVQIFSATRATYQLDESLARAQENGRFALEFLSQDVRHAGYAGCKRDTSVTIFNNLALPVTAGLPLVGISGAEYSAQLTGYGDTYTLAASPTNTTAGWTPALTSVAGVPGGTLAVAATGALPGTDVLALQRMVPNSWALAAPYITPDKVFIDPTFANEVKDGDILMVADCRNAVAFMVTTILPTGEISHTASATTNRCERWTGGLDTANDATASCASPFDYDPESSTAMGKLETVVYFVANDPAAPATDPRPTLFRRVMLANGGVVETTALVDGVENFQVLYGVDDVPPFDGTADNYVTANNVSNFARVVNIQIGLLVYGVNATGTVNNNEIDTDTHDVAGTSIVPAANSKRKRRVFNTTIQLRNRSS
jgi:type IV pilus assembly protein PilW